MAKLDTYAELLSNWQQRINLVSRSTLELVWQRHFADSAQLASIGQADSTSRWLDLGSGAGFPAIVLSLISAGNFHLVEATAKKCRFLAAVVDALGSTNVTIHNARVETLPRQTPDFITARAFAPLPRLFDLGLLHSKRATWLLPKGKSVEGELADATRDFSFDAELIPSMTDSQSQIVIARNVSRKSA